MSQHKDQLNGLYAITDENLIAEHRFNDTVEQVLQSGAKIIQYRDKSNNQEKRLQQATAITALCKKYNAISIINDDIELAKAVNADGIHLGKDDSSITKAREILGSNIIIGVSCYNDIKLAINAEKNSADYVAFGAIFSSPTKPEAANASPAIISDAKQKINLPICAIGGITNKNVSQLITNQTDMVAVISGLFAADNVKQAAKEFSQHFK